MIKKLICIENVGTIQKMIPANLSNFAPNTVISFLGENGDGKTTISEIFRASATGRSDIIEGRKTLGVNGATKVNFLNAHGKTIQFENNTWTTKEEKIHVFNEPYVTENLFSGSLASRDNLANQLDTIIGKDGLEIKQKYDVFFARRKELKANCDKLKAEIERSYSDLLPSMSIDAFVKLDEIKDDKAIELAEKEYKKAVNANEIANFSELAGFNSITSTQALKEILSQNLDNISERAEELVQLHMAHLSLDGGTTKMPIEGWLECGQDYLNEEQNECPFCGQEISGLDLVAAYKSYFTKEYRNLSEQISLKRQTLAKYINGEFRTRFSSLYELNREKLRKLSELTGQKTEANLEFEVLVADLENAANAIDRIFENKLANLAEEVSLTPEQNASFETWTKRGVEIDNYTKQILEINDQIALLKGKAQVDDQVIIRHLKNELGRLRCQKLRYDEAMLVKVEEYKTASKDYETNEKEIIRTRDELIDYTEKTISSVGERINGLLQEFQAGFKVEYTKPNFQGTNATLGLSIVINKINVNPTKNDTAIPCLKNTLSSGDKSTLALAYFLATVEKLQNQDELVVVLDDPFSSMDGNRRNRTVSQIVKLAQNCAQIIVLSHDPYFLRSLHKSVRDKGIDWSCYKLRLDSLKNLHFDKFDIVKKTASQFFADIDLLERFVTGEQFSLDSVRLAIRRVLEHYFKILNSKDFEPSLTLGVIVEKIRKQGASGPYHNKLSDLEKLNNETRDDFHANPSNGSPTLDDAKQLKGLAQDALVVIQRL